MWMSRSLICDVCDGRHDLDDLPNFMLLELPGGMLGHPEERGLFDICSLDCLKDAVDGLTTGMGEEETNLYEPDFPEPDKDEEEEEPEPPAKSKGRLVPAKIPQIEDIDIPAPQPLGEVKVR